MRSYLTRLMRSLVDVLPELQEPSTKFTVLCILNNIIDITNLYGDIENPAEVAEDLASIKEKFNSDALAKKANATERRETGYEVPNKFGTGCSKEATAESSRNVKNQKEAAGKSSFPFTPGSRISLFKLDHQKRNRMLAKSRVSSIEQSFSIDEPSTISNLLSGTDQDRQQSTASSGQQMGDFPTSKRPSRLPFFRRQKSFVSENSPTTCKDTSVTASNSHLTQKTALADDTEIFSTTAKSSKVLDAAPLPRQSSAKASSPQYSFDKTSDRDYCFHNEPPSLGLFPKRCNLKPT